MTVVSSKEFAASPAKYYHRALDEQVTIKRGRNMFRLINANTGIEDDEDDDDEYITMEELRRRIKLDIHQWYQERNENCSISEGSAIS